MSLEGLRSQREKILELASRHGVRNVRLFGSTVRGEDRPDSDLDFLVDVESGRTLLDVIALEQDLEELLGLIQTTSAPDGPPGGSKLCVSWVIIGGVNRFRVRNIRLTSSGGCPASPPNVSPQLASSE